MPDENNQTSPAPAALVVRNIPVGVPVPVDAELDPDSDNPVNNAAVCGMFEQQDEAIDGKQDALKFKSSSITFTSGHREIVLSNLGITVNHLINAYSISTGYDITFNYQNRSLNMVCRSNTSYSGNIDIMIVYV